MLKQHYKASSYTARSSIGYLVKRSFALFNDMGEPALAAQGFTFIQYSVLLYLRDGIAINPRDFCSEFRYDSGALTRVVDQLVERGFVERERGVEDRRKVDLRITPAGRKVVEGLIPTVVDNLNKALADFTGAEVQELSRLLVKLNTTIQADLASHDSAHVGKDPA